MYYVCGGVFVFVDIYMYVHVNIYMYGSNTSMILQIHSIHICDMLPIYIYVSSFYLQSTKS